MAWVRFRKSFRRQRGLVLLISAASLSVMAALGIALLGAPATMITQTQQIQAGAQTSLNAESGYHYALALMRNEGMAMLRQNNGVTVDTGSGSFQISVADRSAFNFTVGAGQTISPGGQLSGIRLPAGQTLPRLNGRFTYDGVEYRYASFAADAGLLSGVERVDGSLGQIVIGANRPVEAAPRTEIVSVGTFGDSQQTLARAVEIRPSQGCPLPWGGRVPVGDWVLAFEEANPACGSNCRSQVRTCEAVGLRPVTGSLLVYEEVVQLSGSHTLSSCSAQNCDCTTPWGTAVTDGRSVVAYETSLGGSGSLCAGRREIRRCESGSLSGSFQYQSCSDPEPKSCMTPLGATVAHGASVVLFERDSPPVGQACQSHIRYCSDGFLSGWNIYDECSERACTTPWGTSVASGSLVTAFESASVAKGETCRSVSATCINGSLPLSHTHRSCSVETTGSPTTTTPPSEPTPSPSEPAPSPSESLSCATPWGASTASGTSIWAWEFGLVAHGGTCRGETRTCNNGSLSGSFQNQVCMVEGPPEPEPTDCTTAWGETVEEGAYVKSYLEETVTSGKCLVIHQQCEKGKLKPVGKLSRIYRARGMAGDFKYPSCTVVPPTCTKAVGDPVLDLGPGRGKLIHPFRSQSQDSSAWYYVWDRDGSGTHNSGSDFTNDRVGKCELPWDAEQRVAANGILFRIPTVEQIKRDIRSAPPGWNTAQSYWTGSVGRRTETSGDGVTWTREYLKGYRFTDDGVEHYDEVTTPWSSGDPLRLSRFVAVRVDEVTCNVPGNSVIDFTPARGHLSAGGASNPTRGLLIHPIQVNDRWFYVWDVDGSGTHNRGSDFSGDRVPASFGLRDSVVLNQDPGAWGCGFAGVCVRYPDTSDLRAIRNHCIDRGYPECYSPAGAHRFQDITPLPTGWASNHNYWRRPIGNFNLLAGDSSPGIAQASEMQSRTDSILLGGTLLDLSMYTAFEVAEGGTFGRWGSVNHRWRNADRGTCR